MGTNRRYAKQIDARMDLQIASGAGPLQTLSPEELDLENQLLTISPKPEPVFAWVRFGDTAIRVKAAAVRWTRSAVGISFDVHGEQHRCWVWSGAVDRA